MTGLHDAPGGAGSRDPGSIRTVLSVAPWSLPTPLVEDVTPIQRSSVMSGAGYQLGVPGGGLVSVSGRFDLRQWRALLPHVMSVYSTAETAALHAAAVDLASYGEGSAVLWRLDLLSAPLTSTPTIRVGCVAHYGATLDDTVLAATTQSLSDATPSTPWSVVGHEVNHPVVFDTGTHLARCVATTWWPYPALPSSTGAATERHP